MYFKFTVQDELLSANKRALSFLRGSDLIAKACFMEPNDLIGKIKGQEAKIFWTALFRKSFPNGMRRQKLNSEINKINTKDDIARALSGENIDLLVLDDETFDILLSDQPDEVCQLNDKVACAPDWTAIEQTSVYQNVQKFYEARILEDYGREKWDNWIKPMLQESKKITVIDRHLASYMFGDRVKKGDMEKMLDLLKKISALEYLKELTFVYELSPYDYKENKNYKKIPKLLDEIGVKMSRKNLKIIFKAKELETKFFGKNGAKSSVIYAEDLNRCLYIEHFGEIFLRPADPRDFSCGKIGDAENIRLQKVWKD